jgi:exopolysaccharide biosynthesis polyprenyl glycosylphosphotransferase
VAYPRLDRRVTTVESPLPDFPVGTIRRDLARRPHMIGKTLALADGMALVLAFALAELVVARQTGQSYRVQETILLLGSLPTWLILAKARGLYDRDQHSADHSTADELGPIIYSVTLLAWIVLILDYAVGVHSYVPMLIVFWLVALPAIVVGRVAARVLVAQLAPYGQRTLVVGAGDVGQLVALKLVSRRRSGMKLVGFVDADPRLRNDQLLGIPIVGKPDETREIVERMSIDRVIIAFSRDDNEQTLALVKTLRDARVQIDIVPRLFDSLGPRATLQTLDGFPLVHVSEPSLSPYALFVKRCFDLVGASLLLVLLAPLFVAIAIQIKLDSPGPVFYGQKRLGRRGRSFTILKFRTMRSDADVHLARVIAENDSLRQEFEALHKLTNDPRVTRIGSILRRSSLDELPQIINVIRGDMSLVGPRPIVDDERHRYSDDLERLVDLWPGMTGYWQISGRSSVSYPERVRLDMAYVRNWSLGLDLLILAKTARALIGKQGAF